MTMLIRNLANVVSLIVVVTVLPRTAEAGAWTQPKGHTYSRSTIASYQATTHFDEGGNKADGDFFSSNGEFANTQFTQILEYGYHEDWTLLGSIVFKSISADKRVGRTDDKVFGPGDLTLGVRRALLRGPIVAAIQGQVELPAGYNADRQDYALGAGEANVDLRAQVGGGLSVLPSWWNLEAGYRFRGGRFSDDFVFGAALGVEVIPRVWGRIGFSGVDNLKSGATGAIEDGVVVEDPTMSASYFSLGGALTYQLNERINLELGMSGEQAGKNTFAGRGIDFTVEIRN